MKRTNKTQVIAALLAAADALEHGAKKKIKASRETGKLAGRGARLTWTYNMKLEELPAKGLKKLRVMDFYLGGYPTDPAVKNSFAFMPRNLVSRAKIGSHDDYDSMKDKLQRAIRESLEDTIDNKHDVDYILRRYNNSEHTVHYLKVAPENMEPFSVRGKDFTVDLSWTEFKSYSPSSDLTLNTPHYTLLVSKSPAAARKLYQALTVMPEAIRRMSWNHFIDWLKKNGVATNYHFSQWN